MEKQKSISACIEYLVNRRFPWLRLISRAPAPISSRTRSNSINDERHEKTRKEVDAYREELSALPVDEIRRLADEEHERELQEQREKSKKLERERFFNQSTADVDLSYWSRMDYWTLDEAIAVLFGKNPKLVNWKSIFEYHSVSEFVQKYRATMELAERAKTVKKLTDPVFPGVFLAWAGKNDLPVSVELRRLVEKNGSDIADWQDFAKNQGQMLEKATISLNEMLAELEATRKEKDELLRRLAAIESREASEVEDKPINPNERHKMLAVILGMAMRAYGFDPNASRNTASGEKSGSIKAALEEIPLAVDADTIRHYLTEAVEAYPCVKRRKS